jgi:hypothetical protein
LGLSFHACLPCFLRPSPLFDPPEARSNRAKRAGALRPDAIGKSAARRAGQKRRLLAAGAQPHGATRSPFFTGEHGEYGEHPPFDAPEHGARLIRDGHESSLRRAAALALRPSIRGGPAVWRQPSPHNLVFGESQDVGFDMSGSNHDAVMRIGGRLLGGGSILQSGTTARVCIGSPPPRIVRALNRHCRSAPNFALSLSLAWGCRDHGAWHSQAALSTTPCGNSPVVT